MLLAIDSVMDAVPWLKATMDNLKVDILMARLLPGIISPVNETRAEATLGQSLLAIALAWIANMAI